MKTIVVYESMFGNTRDIARAVAEGLAEWSDVSITDVDGAHNAVPEDAALVVAGGPTHAFSMTREATRQDAVSRGAVAATTRGLRDWLENVTVSRRVPLATFDTHAKQRWIPGSASKAAAKEGRSRGFAPVASISFFVSDVQGPLVAGELERARHWGRSLRSRVRA
ncbi:flavodoxin family protein [Microbacterium sp. bgisy207]|uniref:flavodoxin family protein n=1 Tax=Microbacterium sp. bgisy207 TaxID=3413800 RepID=UPI003EBB50A5